MERKMDPEIDADCFDAHRGEYMVYWDKHRDLMGVRDELEAALCNALGAMEDASTENRAARILSEHIHVTRAALAKAKGETQ